MSLSYCFFKRNLHYSKPFQTKTTSRTICTLFSPMKMFLSGVVLSLEHLCCLCHSCQSKGVFHLSIEYYHHPVTEKNFSDRQLLKRFSLYCVRLGCLYRVTSSFWGQWVFQNWTALSHLFQFEIISSSMTVKAYLVEYSIR